MYLKEKQHISNSSEGWNKTGIRCILDTRQIDPHKTASIQKNENTSWAKGPAGIIYDIRHYT